MRGRHPLVGIEDAIALVGRTLDCCRLRKLNTTSKVLDPELAIRGLSVGISPQTRSDRPIPLPGPLWYFVAWNPGST
jgi:hypothetical protein